MDASRIGALVRQALNPQDDNKPITPRGNGEQAQQIFSLSQSSEALQLRSLINSYAGSYYESDSPAPSSDDYSDGYGDELPPPVYDEPEEPYVPEEPEEPYVPEEPEEPYVPEEPPVEYPPEEPPVEEPPVEYPPEEPPVEEPPVEYPPEEPPVEEPPVEYPPEEPPVEEPPAPPPAPPETPPASPPAAPPAPPAPPETPPVGIFNDPEVRGFNGNHFHFTGDDGDVYDLHSSTTFQINGRFEKLEVAHDAQDDTGMTEVGIVVNGNEVNLTAEDIAALNAGRGDELAAAAANGETLEDSAGTVTLASGDTIWGHVKAQLGPDASDADIQNATQRVLDANNITWEDARTLQPGDTVDLSVLNPEPAEAAPEDGAAADTGVELSEEQQARADMLADLTDEDGRVDMGDGSYLELNENNEVVLHLEGEEAAGDEFDYELSTNTNSAGQQLIDMEASTETVEHYASLSEEERAALDEVNGGLLGDSITSGPGAEGDTSHGANGADSLRFLVDGELVTVDAETADELHEQYETTGIFETDDIMSDYADEDVEDTEADDAEGEDSGEEDRIPGPIGDTGPLFAY